MRIISQGSGDFDFPYEQVVIQKYGTGVYVLNKNLLGAEQNDEDLQIAQYSTDEKAVKAIEQMRTAYRKHDREKIYAEPYFQFPQDSEV